MQIILKKNNNKRSTLTCIREDGSKTWTQMDPYLEIHDLAHFVVEKTLNFDLAFFGMVKSGYNISDFELPREQRPTALIPSQFAEEAHQAEHLVNLLIMTLDNPNFGCNGLIEQFQQICKLNNIVYPEVFTANKCREVQLELNALIKRWRAITDQSKLVLEF